MFISLINDLFPNIKLEKETYAELEAAIDKEAQAAGLICHPPWILKIIQVISQNISSQKMISNFLVIRNSTCPSWYDDIGTFRCR